jgi:hypothetical protein
MNRLSRALLVLFVAVPAGVVLVLAAALFVGVPPAGVFFPGNALKAMLAALGWNVPNRVGVVATGVLWWALVVGAWQVARRRRRTTSA